MKRLLLNIDLGERGATNPIDQVLVQYADIVNIACGGHAGDAESVALFKRLAQEHGAKISAHLSYPDKANFGRQPMDISSQALIASLDQQRQLLPDTSHIKLHGALYHAADTNQPLADELAAWLQSAGFTQAITPDPGALATACRDRGIDVLPEAFVERRYSFSAERQRAELLNRSDPAACLTTLPEALAQAEGLIKQSAVQLNPDGSWHTIKAGTLCIHGDSPIAETLAKALAKRLRGETA